MTRPTADAWRGLPKEARERELKRLRRSATYYKRVAGQEWVEGRCLAIFYRYRDTGALLTAMADALESLEPEKEG